MATVKERKGKYVVIYDYKDENGNRKQKWETYKTRAEARRRKKQIEFKQQEGTFVIPKCRNLQELLQEYITLYGKDKWALSTYSSNEALIRNYIIPLVGKTKLEEINTLFLEKYYQMLQSTPAVINIFPGCCQEKAVICFFTEEQLVFFFEFTEQFGCLSRCVLQRYHLPSTVLHLISSLSRIVFAMEFVIHLVVENMERLCE